MKAELLETFGGDLMVVNAARVSFGKWKSELGDKDEKLIKFLAKHDHWSPFSHPRAQFRITAPFFVARQWEKHRIGAIRGYDVYDQNEVSRRYVDDEPDFFVPEKWRARPEASIKQGSSGLLECQEEAYDVYARVMRAIERGYQSLLDINVAPEQARMVLPVSAYTTWIETGSLLYWSRVVQLRTDAHAQKEIQDLAKQVCSQMANAFPTSWAELTAQR